ncbi:MAG: 23S rRNA (pseudouridine(1915)-N(3))-methyltransferase RlmH [Desulfocapsa sp.]|jgi:23S rRNA (pseudouridine1915-N3)-methyltransferase|nr:23S rRNA (pseudouridine(1915)-N(3))-methyltransferase RlmH [Desulfocapsa sp.]
MKLELPFLGKTKDSFIDQGIKEYSGRLKHYTGLNISVLKVKRKESRTEEQQRQEEGRMLLGALPPATLKVVLDSSGKQVSSEGLADLISRWEQEGRKQAAFLIGGPTGHSSEVLAEADLLLSFSRMTFTHDMVRLFLLEQLYRAYTIKAGEKYHK